MPASANNACTKLISTGSLLRRIVFIALDSVRHGPPGRWDSGDAMARMATRLRRIGAGP
jgi:hypothetical protein